MSGNIGGFNLSNELEYTHYEYTSGDDFDGNLSMTKKLSFGNIRGRLNYQIKPANELTSGEVQFQTDLSDRTTLGLGLTSEFTGERTKTFRTTIDHRFDKFRLGALAEYATSNDIRIGMNVTYILVQTTRLGNYKMTSSTTSLNSGQLQLVPFVDANGNGTYDDGEKTIPDVTFKNMNRGTKATSDKDGQAVLDGIGVNSINKVTVDTKTLPDIYMMPAIDGLSVFGKTGTGGPLYYPVSVLGEISGMLQYKDAGTGKTDTLPGIEMMLLDDNEKVVAQTYSEYDGFFTFQSVPMGHYTLYLPSSESLSGKYKGDSPGLEITLDPDNTEQSNLDLLIQNGNIMRTEGIKTD